MSDYAVLIPAYNAAHTIGQLLDRIHMLKEAPQKILVVDDGSNDNTPGFAEEHGASVLRLPVNQGKGYALRQGLNWYVEKNFTGNIICLDADLQHPPEVIPDFINKTRQSGLPVIIGDRDKTPGKMPLHRILSNRITSGIISLLTGQKIPDSQCGYRLVHTDVLNEIELYENGFQMESEFILKAARQGVRIGSVPIPVIYNQQGSHIGNFRDTVRFVGLILRYMRNKI